MQVELQITLQECMPRQMALQVQWICISPVIEHNIEADYADLTRQDLVMSAFTSDPSNGTYAKPDNLLLEILPMRQQGVD